MRLLAFILAFAAGPSAAHEFFIEPLHYQIAPEAKLEAEIVNGSYFTGVKLPYLPQGFESFVVISGNEGMDVAGRQGDRPALNQDPVGPGLNVVLYHAGYQTVNYETLEKFESFAEHKDLGDVVTMHRERGLPEENFGEIYARFSKSLIAVGDGAGSDNRFGLETELVALKNPYTDDLSDGMQVQLYYRDELRANEQVEVFEKDDAGEVMIKTYRTDDQGIATFPVKPGLSYMVDAVYLRVPEPELQELSDTVWETLWANLTFAVPE